jgi:hypothetical protein
MMLLGAGRDSSLRTYRTRAIVTSRTGGNQMEEPGLDGRHRDKAPPKVGEIQQKRSDTLNRN